MAIYTRSGHKIRIGGIDADKFVVRYTAISAERAAYNARVSKPYTLEDTLQWERYNLSPRAQRSYESIGRAYPEPENDNYDHRNLFDHDSDRICYARRFNRLSRKAQVFVDPNSDDLKTRIHHVLRVSRTAKDICLYLRENPFLGEAIGLGHDIGHTPFGHEGERVLSIISMKVLGKRFKHEWNSVRVFTWMEESERAPGRRGLNLTGEVLDGIKNHSGEDLHRIIIPRPRPRFYAEIIECDDPKQMPFTLGAAVARFSDVITYASHDYQDGIDLKIFSVNDVPGIVIDRLGRYGGQILHALMRDIKENSFGKGYIAMSKEKYEALLVLLEFNGRMLYYNDGLKGYTKKTERYLASLYDHYTTTDDNPQHKILEPQEAIDEIASMTDRRAINEYARIFVIAPTL